MMKLYFTNKHGSKTDRELFTGPGQ